MNKQPPLEWAHIVQDALLKHDAVPLFGKAPAFPWEEFNVLLARTFKRDDFSVRPSETKWRSSDKLFEGLGEVRLLHLVLTPLEGSLCWAMSQEDIGKLMAYFLTETAKCPPIKDEDLLDGFQRFIAAEVIYAIDNLRALRELTPRISGNSEAPQGDHLTTDITITIKETSSWGRLFISPQLLESWRKHFANFPAPFDPEKLAKMEIDLGIVIGKTEIPYEQWENAKEGDILLLDECTLDPNEMRGPVSITVNGQSLLPGSLSENKVTILSQEIEMAPPQEEEEKEEEKAVEEEPPKEDPIAETTPAEEEKEEPVEENEFEEDPLEETQEEAPAAAETEETPIEETPPTAEAEAKEEEEEDFDFEDDDFDFEEDDDDWD